MPDLTCTANGRPGASSWLPPGCVVSVEPHPAVGGSDLHVVVRLPVDGRFVALPLALDAEARRRWLMTAWACWESYREAQRLAAAEAAAFARLDAALAVPSMRGGR